MSDEGVRSGSPRRELTLFDSTCLIVGIIIGAGLYRTAPDVASGAGGPWGVLALWFAGGLLSLCGALGYAELAAAYPKEGGDYVYLTRAYGRWAGFLFGWIQLTVVRPGDIAVMAFAFAAYARAIGGGGGGGILSGETVYAAAAVIVLTAIHVLGVRQGKWTQNILTVVKVLGLLAIVGVAFSAPGGHPVETGEGLPSLPLRIALILVLFAYGGWNEMAYVAAEVRNPRKNIVRGLVLGTAAVTGIYLLANASFLFALGHGGLVSSGAAAADAIGRVFPDHGARLVSALVCVSALGAVSGLVFTGARISFAVGADHRAFRVLGRWNTRTGTPVRALLVQGAIALLLVALLRSFLDTLLYTAAAVYTFYLATSLAVIVLRRRDPQRDRPYRVTGYPYTTLLFAAVCAFLIHSAVTYRPLLAAVSFGLVLTGLPVYAWSRRRGTE